MRCYKSFNVTPTLCGWCLNKHKSRLCWSQTTLRNYTNLLNIISLMNNICRCHTLQVFDLTSIVKVIQISWYLFHTDKIHVLFTISRHHSRYAFSINVETKMSMKTHLTLTNFVQLKIAKHCQKYLLNNHKFQHLVSLRT